jgi:hypothetical protein
MSSLSNDLPPPRVHTSPWLINFLSAWRAADAASHHAEMDRLKSVLIGKLATVKDDWYELIEAAKAVVKTDKRRS